MRAKKSTCARKKKENGEEAKNNKFSGVPFPFFIVLQKAVLVSTNTFLVFALKGFDLFHFFGNHSNTCGGGGVGERDFAKFHTNLKKGEFKATL